MKILWLSFCFLGGLEGLVSWLTAPSTRQSEILLRDIEVQYVPAPNVPLGGAPATPIERHNQWMLIEFSYTVTPWGGMTYLDEVEFLIWVEVFDQPDPQKKHYVPLALLGEVTYVNVPQSSQAFGSFYLPPGTLNRYGGRRLLQKEKANIHVIAKIKGREVDGRSWHQEKQYPDWFRQLPTKVGLIYRQNESPFISSNTSKYPPIQLKR